MKTVRISFTATEEDKKLWEELAEKSDRSLAWFVRKAAQEKAELTKELPDE